MMWMRAQLFLCEYEARQVGMRKLRRRILIVQER
jgi:hypothetical protein